MRRGLKQQLRQHLYVTGLRQVPQLFQRLGVGLLHDRLLGGQDRFPGLHLGGADETFLPLRRQTLVPGSQIGHFLVRLGLIAGGDRRRLLAGFFQQGVRLRFRVGIQPLDNGINSVHH